MEVVSTTVGVKTRGVSVLPGPDGRVPLGVDGSPRHVRVPLGVDGFLSA